MSKTLNELPRLTPRSSAEDAAPAAARAQTGLFGSRFSAAAPLQPLRSRPPSPRVTDSQGFLLHSYPHRETSLILDVLTREHGRVALIAKGAKRPHSALRAVLASFQQLSFSWSGSQELKTLTKAEWAAAPLRIDGDKAMSAWYLNELLIRLLARDDPHPDVFDAYLDALQDLSAQRRPAQVLRRFEWRLLQAMGYGFDPGCTEEGEPVEQGRYYRVGLESGPERIEAGPGLADSSRADARPYRHEISSLQSLGADSAREQPVSGELLLALAHGRFDIDALQPQLRHFLRERLDYHMSGRAMATRQVLRELTQFLSE